MAFDKKILNSTYALGKNKAGGWVLGMWINSKLISCDGKQVALCKESELHRWKFFTEVVECEIDDSLEVGSKVPYTGPDGNTHMYYVVVSLTNGGYILGK